MSFDAVIEFFLKEINMNINKNSSSHSYGKHIKINIGMQNKYYKYNLIYVFLNYYREVEYIK